ncbi:MULTISPECIES: DegV family protein [unclassified Gemella]|uniref:DegV family protein n=1 Tax=unclassified Gemella TaxID=2624949 RepID=UPI0015CF9390|nr:DegV family protein [Gemella sp. GL1.1]NYS27402.1 DegV family protein [Gemella sp. GL1]
MSKIAVLVDSTAYVSEELKNNKNLRLVYLSVTINNIVKKEIEEISLDEYKFYLQEENGEFPTTSQPAIGDVVLTLEELKSNGYEEVIAIALSSGISGTCSSYSIAESMVEGIKVYPFDSEVSAQAEEFYVKKALEMISKGATSSEIISTLNEVKKVSQAYFIVDDLNHLQKGGRLSSTHALIGGLLQIKPVLHFQDKIIVPYQKIRTYKKAIAAIYSLFDKFYKDHKGKNINICIIHTLAEDKANEAEEYIRSKYPDVKIEKGIIGPVIATHLGLGAIGVGWTIL